MKEITRIEKVYDFEELSESAKEHARERYLHIFHESYMFEEDCIEYIHTFFFPNSDLGIEFSLSSCQGDGLNIYGKMDIKDAVDFVMDECEKEGKHDFDKQIKRFFNWLKTLDYTIELPKNPHYCYCYINNCNFAFDLIDNLEQDGYTSGNKKHFEMLEEFDGYFKTYIEKLCGELEQDGYNYFYGTDDLDEEIIDCWESNGYEGFYEDGEPCYS